MSETQNKTILKDLGNGMILRRATKADSKALAEFNARVHSDHGPEKPDERVAAWTNDLFDKPHPTFKLSDFTIVEVITTGEIVSSMNLISQTWRYGDIQFDVGRPELVGTHPDYRHLGLVRTQFDLIHKWSAERGHKLQAITGIPHFYRRFGYDMALSLGGRRVGFAPDVPKLKDGEHEPFLIRQAKLDDIPFITGLYQRAYRRYLVSCDWDIALWKYELLGKSAQNANRMELRVIARDDDDLVGFLAHPAILWGSNLVAGIYELLPGVSWDAVTPSVIRYLYRTGKKISEQSEKPDEFAAFGFSLGDDHPVYRVMHAGLSRIHKPYAWYLRVADITGFLQHIKPVLESNLASSPFRGHTGEIKITFYKSGMKLILEDGLIHSVEDWRPAPHLHSGDAAFPDLTFLQLMFGYRSFEELDYARADCWWEDDRTFGLLNALFPKRPSLIFPVS